MKRLLTFLLLASFAFAIQAQSYNKVRNDGIQYFKNGDYAMALTKFNHLKQSPVYREQAATDAELAKMIKVCNTKVPKKKKSASNKPAAVKKNSIEISNVTITNAEVDGALGVKIKCSFYAKNMKDKTGRVTCTFKSNNRTLSYEDGEADYMDYIIYQEVGVSDVFDVKSADEYKTMELHVPYAAFRLHSFEDQTFTAHVEIYDAEDSEAKGDPPLATKEESFVCRPASVYVDGSINTKMIDVYAAGGYSEHSVRTGGGEFNVKGVPEWIHITNKSNSSFRLTVDKNFSTMPRSTEFYVQAAEGGNKVKFMINQEGGSGEEAQAAMASITNAQIEHNVIYKGVKSMKVCAQIDVLGMRGKQIFFYLFFYQDDNQTNLIDVDGDIVGTVDQATAAYENSQWSEWCLAIPNSSFLKATNATPTLSFDLVLKDGDGNELARVSNFRVEAK